jgi:hypothetical protein
MSIEVEEARVELELAEDAERVTAVQVMRWLRNRPGGDRVIAAVERATMAVGRAERIRRGAK